MEQESVCMVCNAEVFEDEMHGECVSCGAVICEGCYDEGSGECSECGSTIIIKNCDQQ